VSVPIWRTPTLGDWLEQAEVLDVLVQLDSRADFSVISPSALHDLIFSTWPARLQAPVRTIELREVGSTYMRVVAYLPLVGGDGGLPPHSHVDERARRDHYFYVIDADEVHTADYLERDDERERREDSYRLEDAQGRRYSMLDAYKGVVSAFAALARPGVTLTTEQRAEIKRLQETPPSWPVDEKKESTHD
jgi:hypothetical protein